VGLRSRKIQSFHGLPPREFLMSWTKVMVNRQFIPRGLYRVFIRNLRRCGVSEYGLQYVHLGLNFIIDTKENLVKVQHSPIGMLVYHDGPNLVVKDYAEIPVLCSLCKIYRKPFEKSWAEFHLDLVYQLAQAFDAVIRPGSLVPPVNPEPEKSGPGDEVKLPCEIRPGTYSGRVAYSCFVGLLSRSARRRAVKRHHRDTVWRELDDGVFHAYRGKSAGLPLEGTGENPCGGVGDKNNKLLLKSALTDCLSRVQLQETVIGHAREFARVEAGGVWLSCAPHQLLTRTGLENRGYSGVCTQEPIIFGVCHPKLLRAA